MKKLLSMLLLFVATFNLVTAQKKQNAVYDIDGNVYSTVTIGSQTWMKENLAVTRYNDGTPIPLELDNTGHGSGEDEQPSYCWYNNDIKNKKNYGALYNWYTVNSGKLCPKGWHVPNNEEWKTLIDYLGGEREAGGKLKAKGTKYWASPNSNATNSSNFTALPSGAREFGTPLFVKMNYSAYFWSSSSGGVWEGCYYYLFHDWEGMNMSIYTKTADFSVRCIKD